MKMRAINIRMRKLTYILVVLIAGFNISKLNAKEIPGLSKKQMRTSADCVPTSSVSFDINNVRTVLHNGGDMWWDLVGNPKYEIPKTDDVGNKKHSLFAGALWIGGIDDGKQLRVAAQTYRQSGYDFFPGPLTSDGSAYIDDATCDAWDKHFLVTKSDLDAFRSDVQNGTIDYAKYPVIKDWPAFGADANGNIVQLAPFVKGQGSTDLNAYEPDKGDYPDIRPVPNGGEPDQAIWWVINDKAKIHTETGGQAIGLEMQNLAFSFVSANDINNMTFYKYKVINKSTLTLNETYMGQWTDADLGFYNDDYVGCDTLRGLGFCYNGDANDDAPNGYGLNPPALGIDFFQGPLSNPGDGIDNDKDGLIDELEAGDGFDNDGDGLIDEDDERYERISMSKFVYYNNDFSLIGNPENATHYYNYLKAIWKDGSAFVNNGKNGYQGTGAGTETSYLFPDYPGSSCPYVLYSPPSGQPEWNEASAGNPPLDRRLLQSAGPFVLQPGAVNEIIVGAVWARGYYDDQFGSVCELLRADDVAQALFDNKFQSLTGPDAPDLTIDEYDRGLVLTWDYRVLGELSNNYNETYAQNDPALVTGDATFEFEGYLVYQLSDAGVSASDLDDDEKARLVAQCDLKNGITTIVNRTTTSAPGLNDPIVVDKIMVEGKDEGIFNTIKLSEDLFSNESDTRLRNYTTYYYTVVAYAYNDTSSDGNKFILGNRNFKVYSAMPHKTDFENFGMTLGSDYGDGIEITRIKGDGAGGHYLELSDATVEQILANNSVSDITYKKGSAPFDIKVTNPKEVVGADYKLDVVGDLLSKVDSTILNGIEYKRYIYTDWILYQSIGGTYQEIFRENYYVYEDSLGGKRLTPGKMIGIERPIPGHGISITIKAGSYSGDTLSENTGVVGSNIVFSDGSKQWLTGFSSTPSGPSTASNRYHWNLGGVYEKLGQTTEKQTDATDRLYKTSIIYDPNEDFENILPGWNAYCMTRGYKEAFQDVYIMPSLLISPGNPDASRQGANTVVNLSGVPNIDIVLTSDKSKWSRCIVVEESPTQSLGAGSIPLTAKWKKSVDKDGNEESSDALSKSNQGFGWFPGYAINIDNGKRVNIFFGESTWHASENGNDMMWNPTSSVGSLGDAIGGKHYIYVTNQEYDGCNYISQFLKVENKKALNSGNMNVDTSNGLSQFVRIDSAYNYVAWVGVPMLSSSQFSFSNPSNMPCDVKISLRVDKEFIYDTTTSTVTSYTFSTDGQKAEINQKDVASNALDLIQVVPNPYLGYSEYETSPVDGRVKITNLPQKATIKIFTMNGNLVRTYTKDSDLPEVIWDLKNTEGVPVASGLYIVHIDAGDLGEKVVKMYAIMRKIDLTGY